jgi:hypothetical protein
LKYNIVIIIHINYTTIIIICITNNNAEINNNYARRQDLILLFKIPMARERISSKFVDSLGTRPQKVRQPRTRLSQLALKSQTTKICRVVISVVVWCKTQLLALRQQ